MEDRQKAGERYKRFMERHPDYRKAERGAYLAQWRADNAEYIKQYRRDHPDTRRTRRRIPVPDYVSMLEAQDHRCAICNTHDSELSKPLSLDHNHSTDEVRGLLCHHCNTGLGLFRDNPELLRAAIAYLGRTPVALLPEKKRPCNKATCQVTRWKRNRV
jgi:hypothetical protein